MWTKANRTSENHQVFRCLRTHSALVLTLTHSVHPPLPSPPMRPPALGSEGQPRAQDPQGLINGRRMITMIIKEGADQRGEHCVSASFKESKTHFQCHACPCTGHRGTKPRQHDGTTTLHCPVPPHSILSAVRLRTKEGLSQQICTAGWRWQVLGHPYLQNKKLSYNAAENTRR